MKRSKSVMILSMALAVAIFAQVFVFVFVQNKNDVAKIEESAEIGVSREVMDAEPDVESAIMVVKVEPPKANSNSASGDAEAELPLATTPSDVEAVPPSTKILSPEETRTLIKAAERVMADQGIDVADDEAIIIPAEELPDEIKLKYDIVYYPKTGQLTGTNGAGILYIGFDFDSNQGIFFTPMYPWQRTWGFTEVYDFFSPIIWLFYDTVRLYFTYDNKQWMIQLWKGQYGITSGAEIGVYNRPINFENVTNENQDFYECVSDEDCLLMSFDLYKNDELFFTRQSEDTGHWWLTGFRPLTVTWPEELRMEATITMKDQAMAYAFAKTLNNNGFKGKYSIKVLKDNDNNIFNGRPTDVSFSWQ